MLFGVRSKFIINTDLLCIMERLGLINGIINFWLVSEEVLRYLTNVC